MALVDDVFPKDGHGRPELAQTEWSEGWQAHSEGFGAIARLITAQLGHLEQHNELDDAGAPLVFIQRHRVELGLKAILHVLGKQTPTHHRLIPLVDAIPGALRERLPQKAAKDTIRELKRQRELIELLAGCDEQGQTLRYPVNTNREINERPRFIDPRPLETACDQFAQAVDYILEVTRATYADAVDDSGSRYDPLRDPEGIVEVMPRGRHWIARRFRADRASAVRSTQAEAIAAARKVKGARSVVVYRGDGIFHERIELGE